MQFKVTVLEEGDGVSLSVQFLIPPDVTFRVTKKHPIEVRMCANLNGYHGDSHLSLADMCKYIKRVRVFETRGCIG